LVFEPEFADYDFHARSDLRNMELTISDGVTKAELKEPFQYASVASGVFTFDTADLVSGDFITYKGQTFAITVLSPTTFSINLSFSGRAEFVVNKYNFSYSIVAHTFTG
jgi:hypothetical protein